MQLTIDKYTQMVAPIDVRDLDSANGLLGTRRASATGELGHDRGERFDVVGADDHIADAPAFAAP